MTCCPSPLASPGGVGFRAGLGGSPRIARISSPACGGEKNRARARWRAQRAATLQRPARLREAIDLLAKEASHEDSDEAEKD